MPSTSSLRAYAYLFLLSFVWATVFLAIKIGDQRVAPLTLMFNRAFVATLSLLPFAIKSYCQRKNNAPAFTAKQILCCATVGAIIAYMWVAIAVAETFINSGIAALLTSSVYFFSWLLSVLVVRSKPFYWLHALGVIVATVSLAFAVGVHHLNGQLDQTHAMLFFISGFFAFAVSSLLSKQHTNDLPVMEVATLNLFFTSIFLYLAHVAHLLPWHQSYALSPVLAALWAGVISTGLGYYLYYDLLNTKGPLFANYFGYCVPVFGVVLSVIFMGMPITLDQILAIPVLLFGLYLINLKLTPQPKN